MEEVDRSNIRSNFHLMPSLPNVHHEKFMVLCWHKVDTQFQNRAVTISLSLLPIMACNSLVMDNSWQITYQLRYSKGQISLRLHWGSVSNEEVTVCLAVLIAKAANMLVVTHNWKHIPFQSPYLQYQLSLTLSWCAVKGGSDIEKNHSANKDSHTSTMCTGHSTTLGFYNMQCPKLLMLFWCSGDGNFWV